MHLEHLNVQSFIVAVSPPFICNGSYPATNMTSADFLTGFHLSGYPPVRAFSFCLSPPDLPVRAFAFFGLRNGVLAHPLSSASYPISVRRYRRLQSGFLQCMGYPKPPCHLLILPGVTPANKGLPVRTDIRPGRSPSGKLLHTFICSFKFICIFNLFIELAKCVQCMLVQGTHKWYSACGIQWFTCFCSS
jgi:hypothetical protein